MRFWVTTISKGERSFKSLQKAGFNKNEIVKASDRYRASRVFDTLEDLKELYYACGYELIVDDNVIAIYDDYME